MRGTRAAAVALALLAAAFLRGQVAVPTAKPAPARTPAAKPSRAPLDFSGVWEIDAKESQGVSRNMEKAVLSVHQNGNRIWIEPVEQQKPYLAAEEIVVDGQTYEKALGAGQKGTVQAAWGKDHKSLWIQSATGTDENPNAALQRTVWELRDGGKVWTRRTWTVQKNETRESFLVFRKRASPPPSGPAPRP